MKTVKEAIKEVKTLQYVVSKDGKMLIINGKAGKSITNESEILSSPVRKVEIIPGVNGDVTAIRI